MGTFKCSYLFLPNKEIFQSHKFFEKNLLTYVCLGILHSEIIESI